ncbi:zinc finger protein 652-B-like [Chironomus tepperi]|uniref:zinc finger protein 652-B-like n=1 Tax=Chironomus tepperi TaxID=113505 RepID=UPI00391F1253
MSSLNQCRVCLAERSDLESMFRPEKQTILDIYLITGVKIVEINNQKGAYICQRCIADLTVATEFRKRCIKSDEFVKDCFGQTEMKFWDSQEFNFDSLNILEPKIKCEEEFRQVIKVEPHIEFHSDEEEDYNWKYDEYDPTNYQTNWNEFTLDEETLKSLTCPYCHKKLNTRRSLKYHIQVKHEPQSCKKYECDCCGKAFPNKHPLKRHIHQAHLTVSSKYVKKSDSDMTCILCKVVLKNRKSYRNHVKNKHNKWLDVLFPKVDKKMQQMMKIAVQGVAEDPACPCSICGKIFKNKRNLAQHEKTHKILLPHEYFYCDLCGNKFKEKLLMQIHIRKRHIQKIRYQCELCTCSYTTNHSLQIHIKVRHKNIREWICNWCGKDFGEKKKLVAHERIHTGEQPYICQYCDAKFTHQTDYRRHKWNHEGRKSFKCQMCGEGFVKRSELISHKNRCLAWRSQQMNVFPQHLPPNMSIN